MNRVRYAHPENGYLVDRQRARGRLDYGEIYTVERRVVHAWSTEIFLTEFPGTSFNSVLFEEVKADAE